MRRIGKWLAIVIAACLAVVTMLALFLASVDLPAYKPELEQALSEALDREVRIQGRLRVVPSLTPAVGAEGLTLANVEWGSQPEMVRVESFEVALELLPLFEDEPRVEIDRIELSGVSLLLETDALGRTNWAVDEGAPPELEQDASPIRLRVRELAVDGLRIRALDGASGETAEFEADSLHIERLEQDRDSVSLEARLQGLVLTVSGETSSMSAALYGAPVSFGLDVVLGALRVRADGKFEDPSAARAPDVALLAEVDSLADLTPLLDVVLPASGPLRLATKLSQQADDVFVADELSLSMGANAAEGQLRIRSGERPRVEGKLRTALLDAAEIPWLASESTARVASKGGRLFSAEPLPLGELDEIDLDVALLADRVQGFGPPLDDVSLRLRLDGGRLVVKPVLLGLARGRLDAELRVDASAAKPTFWLRAKGDRIVLGELMQQATGVQLLSGGLTQLSMQVAGRGASVKDWMATLGGEVLVEVGAGTLYGRSLELLGANLLTELVDTLDPTAKRRENSRLECAVLWFKGEGGRMRADRGIALETSEMNLTANGGVDLVTEQLDIAFRARAEKGLDFGAGALTRLVYVAGPLSDPYLTLDPIGIAQQAALTGAFVFTAGASWLAESLIADKTPCRTVLKRAVPGANSRETPLEATKGFFQRLFD